MLLSLWLLMTKMDMLAKMFPPTTAWPRRTRKTRSSNSEPREALVVDKRSVAFAIAALGDGNKDVPQKEAKEGQTIEEDQANQATHDAEDDSSLVTE